MCTNCTFRGTTACHWGSTLKSTSVSSLPLKGVRVHYFIKCTYYYSCTNMHPLKKAQKCTFKGTAPVTSCCTPKGKILHILFFFLYFLMP